MQQPDAKAAEASQRTQKSFEDELSHELIACAIEVQRHLGTGLLESAYGAAMAIELGSRGLRYGREVPLHAEYKGQPVGVAYRADFVVEGRVLLELKAIDSVAEIHRAQLLSYLRLGALKLGLLVNFHAFPVAPRGITRVVNEL